MKRGATAAKIAAVATSLLLAGAYILFQAGVIRIPYLSTRQQMMSSSKMATISAATAQYAKTSQRVPTLPVTPPAVFMGGSKYAVLGAWKDETAQVPPEIWSIPEDGGWEYPPKAASKPANSKIRRFHMYTYGAADTPVPPQTVPITWPPPFSITLRAADGFLGAPRYIADTPDAGLVLGPRFHFRPSIFNTDEFALDFRPLAQRELAGARSPAGHTAAPPATQPAAKFPH